MKTYKSLYSHICAWETLETAYRKARKGKRSTQPVADFEYNWESHLLRLQEELASKTYQPGPYHSFYIHEPKKRLISAAPFRDRVVHHALCRVIEPIFEARFIHDSYANRIKKGTHPPWTAAPTLPVVIATCCSVTSSSTFPRLTTPYCAASWRSLRERWGVALLRFYTSSFFPSKNGPFG